jgi:hypothetical protein
MEYDAKGCTYVLLSSDLSSPYISGSKGAQLGNQLPPTDICASMPLLVRVLQSHPKQQ